MKEKTPDCELVKEYKAFLEIRPIPNRYINSVRLALKKYQQDHNVKTFTEIKLDELVKIRGIGPKTLRLLWEMYGKPETWSEHINKMK